MPVITLVHEFATALSIQAVEDIAHVDVGRIVGHQGLPDAICDAVIVDQLFARQLGVGGADRLEQVERGEQGDVLRREDSCSVL